MSTKESFDSAEGALLRARLHLRGARRRLKEGKISAGIITLFDALIFGLRFYFMVPEHRAYHGLDHALDLTDERAMINVLKNAEGFPSSFDIEAFEEIVDRASAGDMPDYDYRPLLESFEALMLKIEVMPFDESSLPKEDPSTF